MQCVLANLSQSTEMIANFPTLSKLKRGHVCSPPTRPHTLANKGHQNIGHTLLPTLREKSNLPEHCDANLHDLFQCVTFFRNLAVKSVDLIAS